MKIILRERGYTISRNSNHNYLYLKIDRNFGTPTYVKDSIICISLGLNRISHQNNHWLQYSIGDRRSVSTLWYVNIHFLVPILDFVKKLHHLSLSELIAFLYYHFSPFPYFGTYWPKVCMNAQCGCQGRSSECGRRLVRRRCPEKTSNVSWSRYRAVSVGYCWHPAGRPSRLPLPRRLPWGQVSQRPR